MKKSILLLVVVFTSGIYAQTFNATKNLKKFDGFFTFYYDQSKDKILIEVSNLDQEFLYVSSLAAGLGSNDIGLDRGQLGIRAVVKFQKAGNKLLLVEPNQKYRAITENIEEKISVEEAFALSVLEGFEIIENLENKYLIDFTPFLMRDAHGVIETLQRTNQGTYTLDGSKSALYMDKTKAFPKNVEFENILTFKGRAKGNYIKSVAPNSGLLTVRQHHSFVELPDSNYKMREFDTKAGVNSISFLDYATPIESNIKKQYIVRHRLEKKDPNAAISEAKEPIIYYLDRGTPEPVRSALLEGASWWNQAFEASGYKDAFQIKMLPEGADMLDVRYNVIQWVHRSTRGWSYGASVVDPRTGEIIKGHVSLGSLRIRQDYLIAQSLLGIPDKDAEDNPLLEMALARIRQLSVHEVGHTLGFTHNFASSFNNRASVMDYPHPYIELTNNNIDLSNVYDTGIGEWDKVTVAYAYQDFPDGTDEKEALNSILEKAIDKGMLFISDFDARAQGGAHAYAHLWDNGTNPADELSRVLKVRKFGIDHFSENNIGELEPYSMLEDVFVPLYFFHRYQVEAAVKMIGGMEYSYATKGDGQTIVKSINPADERKAMESIISSIQVENLKIPQQILQLFPPRAFGYPRTRESFKSNNGVAFDALGAASTATNLVASLLFHPERASRMIQQKSLNKKQVGLEELIDNVVDNTFKKSHKDSYDFEVQQSINGEILQNLFALAVSEKSIFQVKSIVSYKIKTLKSWLFTEGNKVVGDSYAQGYIQLIEDFEKNPTKYIKIETPSIPAGSPIGAIGCYQE